VAKRKNVEVEVDWLKYFHSIKHVCPWSLQSYTQGTTLITQFDKDIIKLNELNWRNLPWEVIVYLTGDDLTLNAIDEFVAHRNDSQERCEYLWSHPSFTKGGNNQTPVPVIIQQDRENLMELRYGKKMVVKKKT
jgi:hypothetical protein|tara:strand:+ start:195 stop:596 length:402 start_codon:yes stop_codon:yes gene_type:complete